MDQSPDLEAVRRAALVRRDFVLWIAKALQNRAEHVPDTYDRDLMRSAAAELRSLVE